MIKIKGQFIVDASGKKKSVIIPYRTYENLMEDLHDLTLIAERKHEKPISHEEMVKRLKKNGLL